MEQSRPKRVKTSATRVRRREVGSPSARDRGDPTIHSFCKRLNFSFPHDMEAQGTIQFMELKGQVYPALAATLHYCLHPSTEEHNHAQPTVNDLRFMYAVKNNVMINWPEESENYNSVSLSQSKLLPYSIFISRIVDYLRIDVSDTIIVEYTDKDHLVGESLIHKMGIYKYGSTWQYQEDYTTFGLDLSDDDNQDDTDNQHATAQGEPSGSAPQKSAFGFDQLEAMEQRLNNQFQKLSMLIRGDQNIVTSVDHTDDPHPPPQP
ncbi:hypothetical protein Lal_00039692 [Lupinus albus]|nr:hypothetical protein Lal_00039692 [Lupinus albus]